ncbi:MAG: hypothetical protein QOE69_3086 [Thermoleophilaceae bacterium]|nr:hypothetical protein [Thermoleophilaceae bacterium]MEA2408967.1 hypothetical protein [Thermoleophilaceae bacterium]
MRELLSKSTAGGLSAGVVLVWWPLLFEHVDTVTSWFIRGVAWTVCFELLMFALVPVERALWETRGGERLSGRVGAAGSRLHAGSPRRKLGRLSALATAALVVPAALLVMGLQEQLPAKAEAATVRPVKVVRVTKVVNVRKVVQGAPVVRQAVPVSTQPQFATPAAPRASAPARKDSVAVGRAAPVERETQPLDEPVTTGGSGDASPGDAPGSSTAPAAP